MNRHSVEPKSVFTDATATPWKASVIAAGVEVKPLGVANGRAMQEVRFQPGTVFPTHRNASPEVIYLLEGEATQNGHRLGPGWAGVAARGTLDEHFRSETGGVFLLVSDL